MKGSSDNLKIKVDVKKHESIGSSSFSSSGNEEGPDLICKKLTYHAYL